jgi:hypothetical protein
MSLDKSIQHGREQEGTAGAGEGRGRGMKARLVFQRTAHDNVSSAWLDIKTIVIDLPDWIDETAGVGQYELIGMERIEKKVQENA